MKINTRKIFYSVTIFSLVLFAIGFITIGLSNHISFDVVHSNKFAMFTMFVPFALWAWLIIFGVLFVKKNFAVVAICTILAIPHIIYIMVSIGLSYTPLDILKVYVLILSFGGLKFLF